ncbi:hypothetical protein EDB81DRAFT_916964 [Dactylonectria macrodidyma]|uniref:Uncharacterized protein n=1 Tax=Dactylonectria macrodidyma TaxID=307937 RepID=A0A9P9DBW1_9HYPO|nr:hypothetical protein EDB81DRAFT_916964 [Dactylonectria macrodidyma]
MSLRCYQNKIASGWAQSVSPTRTIDYPSWGCDTELSQKTEELHPSTSVSTPTSMGGQASEMNHKAGAQNSQNSGPTFGKDKADPDRLVKWLEDPATGRPTVFVGHSLGGNVIQHGLLYANSEDEFKDLAASAVGIVFLGSPLRGTKLQFLPHLLTAVTSPAGSHDGIIKELAYDDPSLAEMVKRPTAQHLSLFQHPQQFSVFHVATRWGIVQLVDCALLPQGNQDVLAQTGESMATAFVNSKGAPPLEEAAKSGYVEIARRMLD